MSEQQIEIPSWDEVGKTRAQRTYHISVMTTDGEVWRYDDQYANIEEVVTEARNTVKNRDDVESVEIYTVSRHGMVLRRIVNADGVKKVRVYF